MMQKQKQKMNNQPHDGQWKQNGKQKNQQLTSGRSKNNNEKSKTKNNQPLNNNLTKMKSSHHRSRHLSKGDNARTAVQVLHASSTTTKLKHDAHARGVGIYDVGP